MKVITAGGDASPPILCTFHTFTIAVGFCGSAAPTNRVWGMDFTIFVENRIDHRQKHESAVRGSPSHV